MKLWKLLVILTIFEAAIFLAGLAIGLIAQPSARDQFVEGDAGLSG